MKLINEKINFKDFFKKFKITESYEKKILNSNNFLLNEVVTKIGSRSFNNGLFRTYNASEIELYTKNIEESFPNSKNKIICFGRDWLNRQFTIKINKPYHINRFDIYFNDVIDIPISLKIFFEEEIIEYTNELLSEEFFYQWQKSTNNIKILSHQCVNFKIPPSLGGKDDIDNLELADSDVSWEINSQLRF